MTTTTGGSRDDKRYQNSLLTEKKTKFPITTANQKAMRNSHALHCT